MLYSGTAGGLCSVYVVGISQFKPVFNLRWGGGDGGTFLFHLLYPSHSLPLPLLPGSHSLPSPTKIPRLEPYQKAYPNTLNTGLNFGVILPITCIHVLTSQQLHQSFELESNSSLTRTMLLSTERKKSHWKSILFWLFLVPRVLS